MEPLTGTTGALINRVMNFEIEAAFVSEPFTASKLDSIPIFREELVLITPEGIEEVHTAKDLGRSTMIRSEAADDAQSLQPAKSRPSSN